jgi:hypothetical protein
MRDFPYQNEAIPLFTIALKAHIILNREDYFSHFRDLWLRLHAKLEVFCIFSYPEK